MSSSLHIFGKRGYLRLGFELDGRGRSILRDLERRAPIIVQQALYFDEQMPDLPCVYILSAGGPVVEGDVYSQEFILRSHASAHISTGAATKVARMRGGEAVMNQFILLEEGAYLEYLPEPVIPCLGARYVNECEISASPEATLFYSEIYSSGRRFSGERFCYDSLSLTMRIKRLGGEKVYEDYQRVVPSSMDIHSCAVLGGYEIFASVLMLVPRALVSQLYDELQPAVSDELALGVHLLPNDAGVVCRILGRDTMVVKMEVRRLCAHLRRLVKGCDMPKEFPWK